MSEEEGIYVALESSSSGTEMKENTVKHRNPSPPLEKDDIIVLRERFGKYLRSKPASACTSENEQHEHFPSSQAAASSKKLLSSVCNYRNELHLDLEFEPVKKKCRYGPYTDEENALWDAKIKGLRKRVSSIQKKHSLKDKDRLRSESISRHKKHSKRKSRDKSKSPDLTKGFMLKSSRKKHSGFDYLPKPTTEEKYFSRESDDSRYMRKTSHKKSLHRCSSERDFLTASPWNSRYDHREYGAPSTSNSHPRTEKNEITSQREARVIQPDRSKGDYYCKLCDSHMSTDLMWESHIIGKRHRKNLKKEPGERPSKIKTVKCPNKVSLLKEELENLDEHPGPIVGLDYISETVKSDRTLGASYNCYLCGGCFTRLNVIDHLITTKHKLNYIQEADSKNYDFLMAGHYSTYALDGLVHGVAADLEDRFGRGKVEVRVEMK